MKYNHFEYFSMLCKKLHAFTPSDSEQRFFPCSESDNLLALNQKISSVNYWVMVAIDGRNADFSDYNSDNLTRKNQYFVLVLAPANNDNSESIIDVNRQSEVILLQLVARMRYDSKKGKYGLIPIDFDSITIRSVGPIGDCLYGMILSFVIEEPSNEPIDPSLWI